MKKLSGAIFVGFLSILLSGCLSPLMQAIEKNDVNNAKELIARGADTKKKSSDCYWHTHVGSFSIQCTPLMHAAEYGRNEIIRLLLDKGADINEKVEGWTALQWAASSGQIESVKLLLDKGADISGALAEAVYEGNFDVVKLLIDKGADVNGKGRNWREWSILDEAARMGHTNIVKLLIEKGADADATITRFEGLSLKNPNDGDYKAALNLVKKYSGKQDSDVQTATSKPLQVGLAAPIIKSDIDDLPAIISEPRNNAYAVVIGIENYRQKLPKADFAVSDARLVSEYLTKVMGYQEENVVLLTNEKALQSDLTKYFEKWLHNHVEKDSTVFIYYSGHGAPDPKTGGAYLVPYDGDPSFIAETGYSLKRMYDALGKLPAKKIVVALDSCFSGAGGRSVLAKGARPLVMNLQENMVLSKNMTVMSASSGEQISSTYDEKGHGLFTYFMLKGIKNEDVVKQDGSIKMDDLFSYLKPQVERIARKQYNNEQSPQLIEAKKN